MSLPKNLQYNNHIKASHARNFQTNIQPQNGREYGLGETIIVNIPTSHNQVLSGSDTVLKGTLNVAATIATVANLDRSGVASVIQRLRIFHGSTLLSDIDNYGNLLNMLLPSNYSKDDLANKMNILMGTNDDCGRDVGNVGAGAVTVDFAFPLLSILSLTNNYVPIWAMTGAPLRLEIQLTSDVSKILASDVAMNSGASLLTNVELVGNFMELSNEGMEIVRKTAGPVVQWVVSDYRNYAYNTTLGTSETQVSVPIPAKYNSLKALYWTFRQNSAGVLARYPNESCNFSLNEYTVRIGSQVVPAKAPQSIPEFYSEYLRSIGTVSDVNHKTAISLGAYQATIPVAYTTVNQESFSFYVGLDLESYSNTDMTSVYSGMNTSTSDIFFNPKFGAQGGATNIRIDTYALFDSLITFQDGFATVQY